VTTVTFNNSGGGNFGTGINWTTDHFPVAGDTGDITNAFAGVDYSVDVTDAEAAALINIGIANGALIVESGGVLTVGSIDLTAGTLEVVSQGEITGGTTITDGSGTSTTFTDGTLDGVTWDGTLALDGVAQASLLTITTSLNVLNEAGNGPGEIDITGPGAEMDFDGTMTLNGTGGNLVVNIGTSSAQAQFLSVGSNAILTLGTAVSLNQAVAGSTIDLANVGGATGGTIANDGTMSFTSGAGSGAIIDPSNFVNNGTIIDVGGGSSGVAGEDVSFSPLNSFEDGATAVIQVSDFGEVDISGPNGSVDVSGTISISGHSTVDLTTASVAVSDTSGTGAILVSTTSTVDINFDYTGAVVFLDATGTLALDQPSDYTGTVVGLSRINSSIHDSIDLLAVNPGNVTTVVATFSSPSGGQLSVMDNTTTLATINLLGNYVGQSFSFAADGLSTPGTDVFLSVECFAAGSRIMTDRGEVLVESLHVGDMAATLSGPNGMEIAATYQRIRWIGVSRIDLDRHPGRRSVAPIRILAGAFGEGLPRRDLRLSPDHAVYVDGVLIPIQYLENGTTIRREAIGGVVMYYHVELDEHAVLVADGLPVESYLETGGRAHFDNGGVVRALYPRFVAGRWEAEGCARLIVTGPMLSAVRDRVNSRVPAFLGDASAREAGARRTGSSRV
jgi:hypothetical protein